MITPWFNAERSANLWAAAQSWSGTPFFARACSKGAGVDCVNLVHALFVEMGALPAPLALPEYSLDRAKHATKSQLLEFLLFTPELRGRFLLVPPAGHLRPGDILGISVGHVDHHLAVVTPWEKVCHAVQEQGVIFTELSDPHLLKRVAYVLRLMEGSV
jgi:hypothetical protein